MRGEPLADQPAMALSPTRGRAALNATGALRRRRISRLTFSSLALPILTAALLALLFLSSAALAFGYDPGILSAAAHDPSFEADVPRWAFTATGSTYGSTTDSVLDGARTFRSTSLTTDYSGRTLETVEFVPVVAGREYRLEVGWFASGAQWADNLIELNLLWFDAADAPVATATAADLSLSAQSIWEIKSLTAIAPANAVKAKILIRWRRTNSTTSGRQQSFDRIALLDLGGEEEPLPPFGLVFPFAGTGGAAFSGDGGPAVAAELNRNRGVAVAPNGDIYIADHNNFRIRKVDRATGIVTTIAGTNSSVYNGDGIPATVANLNQPVGLAIATNGDIYIAEIAGHRIRKVDGATGIITTVAGTGSGAFSGDGGPATEARLRNPHDVALDEEHGLLFIADRLNQRIRRVDLATGIITTVAGTGLTAYNGDGIQATAANLNHPNGITAIGGGSFIFTEISGHRIRKVDGATGIITTVAGTGVTGFTGDSGPATDARIASPQQVDYNSGDGSFLFADGANQRIRWVSPDGVITTVAGTGTRAAINAPHGDGGLATDANLGNPVGVAFDSLSGLFFVSEQYTNVVRLVRTEAPAIPPDHILVAARDPNLLAPETSRTVRRGAPFEITLSVRDAEGAPVVGYAGVVDLSASAGSLAPAQIVFDPAWNGETVVTATLSGAAIGRVTILAADNAVSGTTTVVPLLDNRLAINEVLPVDLPELFDRDEWVELHNRSREEVSIAGMELTTFAAGQTVVLPDTVIPVGGFAVVHYRQTGDDFRDPDGPLHLFPFTGTANRLSREDHLALYASAVRSAENVLSYVAWSSGDVRSTTDDVDAVAAGLWEDDRTVNHGASTTDELAGRSILRPADGADLDMTVADWSVLAPAAAHRFTEGFSNASYDDNLLGVEIVLLSDGGSPDQIFFGEGLTVTLTAAGGGDPTRPGVTSLHVTSLDDSAGIVLTLRETALNSRIYVGRATVEHGAETPSHDALRRIGATAPDSVVFRWVPDGVSAVAVVPGPLARFDVAAPFWVRDGAPFEIGITARNPFGALKIDHEGAVRLSTSSGVLTPEEAFFTAEDKGVLTVEAVLTGAGIGPIGIEVLDPTTSVSASTEVRVIDYDPGILSVPSHDPSFEGPAEKWTYTATGSTYGATTDPALDGERTFRSTSNTLAYSGRSLETIEFVPVEPGREYRIEVGWLASGAQWADNLLELNILWFDAGGALLSTNTATDLVLSTQNEWELKTLEAASPASAEKVKIRIRWRRTNSTTSGRQQSFDRVAFHDIGEAEPPLEPDTVPPEVRIAAPAEGDFVGETVIVFGRAFDENLSRYTLAAANAADPVPAFTVLVAAEENIEDGPLGTIDLSHVSGEAVILRLRAEDAAGNMAETSVTVGVVRPLPELVITNDNIKLSDTNPIQGQTVRVSARIDNDGDADAENVEVVLRVNGVAVDAAVIPRILHATSSETVIFEIEATEEGLQILEIEIDPNRKILQRVGISSIATASFLVGELFDGFILIDAVVEPEIAYTGGTVRVRGIAEYNPALTFGGPVAGGYVEIFYQGIEPGLSVELDALRERVFTGRTLSNGLFDVTVSVPLIEGTFSLAVLVSDRTVQGFRTTDFAAEAPSGPDLLVRTSRPYSLCDNFGILRAWEATEILAETHPVLNDPPVTFRGRIWNVGRAAAADVEYRWLLDGVEIDSGVIPFLDGRSGFADVSVTIDQNVSGAGFYTLRLEADPNVRIPDEFRRENNFGNRTFYFYRDGFDRLPNRHRSCSVDAGIIK